MAFLRVRPAWPTCSWLGPTTITRRSSPAMQSGRGRRRWRRRPVGPRCCARSTGGPHRRRLLESTSSLHLPDPPNQPDPTRCCHLTSACCSATSPSTCSGWGRPPWPVRWWSGSTRPVEARHWPATSAAPTAGCWSPMPRGRPCSTASTPGWRTTGSSGSTTPAIALGWRRSPTYRPQQLLPPRHLAPRTSSCCCSPRARRARPRPSGAPRAGWPRSPCGLPRPTGSTPPTWRTAPCLSFTATP